MRDSLDNLRAFNRKERFFLVGQALGKPSFTLDAQFRGRLDEVFGLQVPENAFVAMDYHLDWLYASLFLHEQGTTEGIHPRPDDLITANQEDADLLIAYMDGNSYHIILLEAKGATGYTNKQMDSKAGRLTKVFGRDGRRWSFATPHFALLSPRRPSQLNTDEWPGWMKADGKPAWLPLPMPADLVRVTRCDENGKAAQDGKYWRVVRG